jgi:hypothetical protein
MSLSWCYIPENVIPIMISLIEKAAVNKEAIEQGFLVVKPLLRKHYCRTNDMVNIYGISMSENIVIRTHNPSFSHAWLVIGFLATRRCHQWSKSCSPFRKLHLKVVSILMDNINLFSQAKLIQFYMIMYWMYYHWVLVTVPMAQPTELLRASPSVGRGTGLLVGVVVSYYGTRGHWP